MAFRLEIDCTIRRDLCDKNKCPIFEFKKSLQPGHQYPSESAARFAFRLIGGEFGLTNFNIPSSRAEMSCKVGSKNIPCATVEARAKTIYRR